MKFFEYFAIFTVMVAGLNAMIPNGVQVGDLDRFAQVQNPGTFPYIVHLEIEKFSATINAYGMLTCGGSIIRTNVILTAAHCVEGALPENVEAIAGIVHTGIFQESKQSITARRIVCHEEFRNPWKNDIALVFLKTYFQNSRYVDTITLARPSQYQDLMSVTAVGWGHLLNEIQTQWLHRGDFVMLGRDLCQHLTGVNFHDRLLCTIDAKALQKTAKGDSGGPLVRNNFLVGLTVGGIDGGDFYNARVPSVFTNVSHYTNWISEKIGYDILFFEK